MSNKTKRGIGPRRPSHGYDVVMIRDFLENLMWELRCVQQELTSDQPEKPHTELEEQLQGYMEKYHHAGLMHVSVFDDKNEGHLPQESKDEATAYWRAARTQLVKEWISHLEGLHTLLEEAFDCAAKNQLTAKVYKYSTFLQHRRDDMQAGDPI